MSLAAGQTERNSATSSLARGAAARGQAARKRGACAPLVATLAIVAASVLRAQAYSLHGGAGTAGQGSGREERAGEGEGLGVQGQGHQRGHSQSDGQGLHRRHAAVAAAAATGLRRHSGPACGPMDSTGLSLLQALCFSPANVLDIGANKGYWSRDVKKLFPNAKFMLLDGSDHRVDWQDILAGGMNDGDVVILDSTAHKVNWFEGTDGTGDSIFKESTGWFKSIGGRPQWAETLDEFLHRTGRNQTFELMKLDVQGAEISVLQGGSRTLDGAQVVLLEFPFAGAYNKGAPLFAEYVQYMDKMGFHPFDIVQQHRMLDSGSLTSSGGYLIQVDMVYVRKGSPFLEAAQHAIQAFGGTGGAPTTVAAASPDITGSLLRTELPPVEADSKLEAERAMQELRETAAEMGSMGAIVEVSADSHINRYRAVTKDPDPSRVAPAVSNGTAASPPLPPLPAAMSAPPEAQGPTAPPTSPAATVPQAPARRLVRKEGGVNSRRGAGSIDVDIVDPNDAAPVEAAAMERALAGACRSLGQLEESADASSDLQTPEVSAYLAALAAWRSSHPGEQPKCRTDQLGAQLCKEGAMLSGFSANALGGGVWDSLSRELVGHEQNATDCWSFASRYYTERWNPQVFYWPDKFAHEGLLDDLLADPEYDRAYARAGHLSPPYGATEVQWCVRPPGRRFRMERAEHLAHLRVLRKSAPGTEVAAITQVVEFGGGTGDVAAMLRDLSFRGTHFVYDLPPILLMQRFWLRYSGVPAFLGSGRLPKAEAMRGRVLLESSLGTSFEEHLDRARLNETLFLGTFSLTEASLEARQRIRPLLRELALIQLAFWQNFDGIDNDKYLKTVVDEDLSKSHNVVSWQMKNRDPGNFYLIAVRKDKGAAVCAQELGCGMEVLHPHLGTRGYVLMPTMPRSRGGRRCATRIPGGPVAMAWLLAAALAGWLLRPPSSDRTQF